MATVKIRFNTHYAESDDPDWKWRILVDGEERLAKSVVIRVPTYTTEDRLPTGVTKWHLTCEGRIEESAGVVTIS